MTRLDWYYGRLLGEADRELTSADARKAIEREAGGPSATPPNSAAVCGAAAGEDPLTLAELLLEAFLVPLLHTPSLIELLVKTHLISDFSSCTDY
jgi:hypothetical protein